jgi:2-oxoacid:acceptor oxidoreductase delta subunit (pyruvate/2-ketoisovalerate family)
MSEIPKVTSWKDFPPLNASIGTMQHNRTGSWRFIKPLYEDKVPACQNACPAGNDIEGWIKLLQKEETEAAFWHLKREEPFPAILGRVCFRFCESACNRAPFDSCVNIRDLERFVGERFLPAPPHPELPPDNGASLAVIGSGPAGMSAAYFGRLLGFKVTLLEALPEPGGILRVGIPAYRLPRHIVAAEFEGLKTMGVSVRPGTAVGRDLSMNRLRERFDYLFLATGNHAAIGLQIEGEKNCPRVMSGLDMLKRVASGRPPDLGRTAVVVGGGNTAIDAARTAVRLGCEVTVLYRRSEAEMPAHAREVSEAAAEGVRFRFLAAAERIAVRSDGAIEKLFCREMALGPPDADGRRRPVPKPDAGFELRTDCLLTAIGEAPRFDYLAGAVSTGQWHLPVDEGLRVTEATPGGARIFAGGDIIAIPHTVVHAVAAGKKAAIAMDCDRRGRDYRQVLRDSAMGNGGAVSFSRYMGWQPVNPVKTDPDTVVSGDRIVYDYFRQTPPVQIPVVAADRRKGSLEPYEGGFDPAQALQEARRCLHCGRCTECDNCLVFCPDLSVQKNHGDGFGYRVDYDYCKGCGICFNECPRHAITMVAEDTPVGPPAG